MTSLLHTPLIVSVTLLLAVTTGTPQTNQVPTNQGTKSPAARVIGRKLREKGVPNFGEVTPMLYRGGRPNATGFKALARMGVKIVVDLRGDNPKEEREVKKLGMKYVTIPWHCPWPKDEVFAKFLKLLQANRGQKVFVHCRLGDDRTGMMTAAYRMAEEGWSADEAMAEMKAFGFSRAHHLICPGLAGYEKEFPDRLRSGAAFAGVRSKP